MAYHKVVQFKYAQITNTSASNPTHNWSTVFNGDATGRQGNKIMEIKMTPVDANNKILLEVSLPITGETSDHSNAYGSAIYQDNSTDPLQVWLINRQHNDQGGVIGNVNHQDPCAYCVSVDAGNTNERTYHLYYGMNAGAVNVNTAGNATIQVAGTSVQSVFTATEIMEGE